MRRYFCTAAAEVPPVSGAAVIGRAVGRTRPKHAADTEVTERLPTRGSAVGAGVAVWSGGEVLVRGVEGGAPAGNA